jgi:hypothetical protein
MLEIPSSELARAEHYEIYGHKRETIFAVFFGTLSSFLKISCKSGIYQISPLMTIK